MVISNCACASIIVCHYHKMASNIVSVSNHCWQSLYAVHIITPGPSLASRMFRKRLGTWGWRTSERLWSCKSAITPQRMLLPTWVNTWRPERCGFRRWNGVSSSKGSWSFGTTGKCWHTNASVGMSHRFACSPHTNPKFDMSVNNWKSSGAWCPCPLVGSWFNWYAEFGHIFR